MTLIAEGAGTHVSKGRIHVAMTSSFAVEMINIRMRKRTAAPVHPHKAEPK
ncbi:MAG TPA: hypothetical protein VFQ16_02735 [Burkholderiaceae bacterium]|nr:hypothetical protein [Burkholderiaceae bacterium]